MIVYNVLFKGVEKNSYRINYAKCFATFEEACNYAQEDANNKNLTIKSSMGFLHGDENTVGSLTDYRCEDEQENSYYYVIYVQEIKI
jgi:hypothetical protein